MGRNTGMTSNPGVPDRSNTYANCTVVVCCFRRRTPPIMKKPSRSIAQVDGSGTADCCGTSSKPIERILKESTFLSTKLLVEIA